MSNEPLGLVEEGTRRRFMHPQHARVAPDYHTVPHRSAAPLDPATLDLLRTIADALSERTRIPAPVAALTPTAENVMEAFCVVYQEIVGRSYSFTDLRSVRRSAAIAKPRHVCMLLVKEICGLSQTKIGDRFHRDHTTVLFALRRARIHLMDPMLRAAHDATIALFAEAKQ